MAGTETIEDCHICGQGLDGAVEVEEEPAAMPEYDCPQCGTYRLRRIVEPKISAEYAEISHLISGHIREANLTGETPSITRDNLPQIVRSAPRKVPEMLSRLLLNMSRAGPRPGDEVEVHPKGDRSMGYAMNEGEMLYLIRRLRDERNFIRGKAPYKLTVEGWEEVGRLQNQASGSNQGFVAMWNSDPEELVDEFWKGSIGPAIEAAGYDPWMAAEEDDVQKIDARITRELDQSRFVVADVTGERPSVYFEAGYAIAQGIPVIWTVQASDDKDRATDLHFDTRQYNHLFWEDPADRREDLRYRIEALVGRGAKANEEDE